MSEVMKAVQLHVSHLQTSPFPVDVYMQMNPHSSASYSSSSWPFYIKLQTRKQVNRRKVLLENFFAHHMFTKKNQLNRCASLYKMSFFVEIAESLVLGWGYYWEVERKKKVKADHQVEAWMVSCGWMLFSTYFNDNQSGIFLLTCHALWLIIKGIIKLLTTAINWLINPGSVWTIIIINHYHSIIHNTLQSILFILLCTCEMFNSLCWTPFAPWLHLHYTPYNNKYLFEW